jgi:hypothetical protein
MKLEFLPNGPNNAGLIRLCDYSQSDVHALSKIASELATGPRKQIALQSESWVVSVGGCKLIPQRGERDFGIRQAAPLNFECELSADGWNNVEGLLEPFCNPATTGFQWLTSQGRISFLISNNGQW